MTRYKNYEAIYDILKNQSEDDQKKLFTTYIRMAIRNPDTNWKSEENPDWAYEATRMMAYSDGLTQKEVQEVMAWYYRD